ncbi:GNAT family N-acetyltransferase [Chitinophaga qingshengii]|uniref:GNAT family N-acetyltransferase n=1 Tax=Chitinophaga qingshengii TaxID=1569794 RepID=A0ABR7TRP4_9BACT|nr:GNAT family N-acetyltransferase [Chitinophaga qingshengii]MBC9933137.1 GNAT family N-acetyltransferase [Chitinophaga qingshengii]
MDITLQDIVTSRLTLRLLGTDVTEACLQYDFTTAAQLLQATIPTEFQREQSSLQHDRRQLSADPAYRPWASRAILLRDEMIGLIRFHSRPEETPDQPYRLGAAELGYHIFAAHRRKGYAREAIQGMLDWATEYFHTRRFIVSIAPDNLPSLELARTLGFVKVDEAMDETDGLEYVYLLENS